MREVTKQDFEGFARAQRTVVIEPAYGKREAVVVSVGGTRDHLAPPPADFKLEATTVWSFPKRGAWATHQGNYRGNWAPQIPRNLVLRYTKPGETVLDPMVGSGTTLIECKLLARNGIGVDVNENAIMLTRDRLNFDATEKTRQRTFVGDARNLDRISAESVDFVATHPPYADIISYSAEPSPHDLSQVHGVEEFASALREVAAELIRVLKPGRYAAVLMGDTRRKQLYVPLAYRTMQAFLDAGFDLKEDIIKRQWNCQATPFWQSQSTKFNFHLIMHEHLFVFRKPPTTAEGSRH